jgi:hypothetical protein
MFIRWDSAAEQYRVVALSLLLLVRLLTSQPYKYFRVPFHRLRSAYVSSRPTGFSRGMTDSLAGVGNSRIRVGVVKPIGSNGLAPPSTLVPSFG